MGLLERLLAPWTRPPARNPYAVSGSHYMEQPRSATWLLPIPTTAVTQAGELAAGAVVETGRVALTDTILGATGPTIMERWRLEHLHLPSNVQAATAAEPAETLIAVMMLELLRGGDPVWTQPLEVPMTPTNAGRTTFSTNFTFGEALPTPVVLERGRRLELACTLAFNLATTSSSLQLSAWAGAVSRQGQIQYRSEHLDGRRRL